MKLTSYSSIASLSSGDWDGHFSLATIKKTGDLAVGTFDQGNGEMLAIDGEYYQLLSDGGVNLVLDEWTSPYAVNVFFNPEFSLELNNVSQTDYLKALGAEIEKHGNQYMYAIRVTGDFKQIISRTVSLIPKPYPTIKEINNIQRVREFENIVEGNIVGFYTPKYLNTVSVDGFHQHFINHNRDCGGHVLDFHASYLKIEFAKVKEVNLLINDHSFDYHDSLQSEIELVEKSK
ncbi:Alpha-acetolactate decarboxylase [Mesoplasma sp. JKS002658]|uniref:acetolactate decarboxylase n=1 Tax=Mesoplasma whartonense TaxID=2878854 RepID=UPI002022A77A|nr:MULTISPECIES: acetolactate decarboxylase [unclassified Mesoplasma]MCL8211451.1 Alpha-acetolactate decarboxylase [Mesoplasma sp. JKS002664]MCL8212303.1 Alpha-acetolactate decarboxylase [Mesoplasma sp. JKS002662]MCL8212437.1 Alpha-acetolactate decarboxylase [Mesoplasma sp. JKS002661]MCL8213450.1 Alpha-acetolactate decarboxylase [Mesoplasma sp. JKS002660]MCL8214168.1 Alpha-acetolactate decarboxylase [Mesoplasma sp. JKS002658]